MMKKLIALLLALLMVVLFAACAASDADDDSDKEDDVKQEEKDNEANDDEEEEGKDKDEQDLGEISFTEQVVVDNDECVITITGIEPDGDWGYTLKAELENKSSDKTYMFSVDSASINGVVTDPYFASDVAAGKKAREDISFMDENLEKNDIGEYTDIELTFSVSDADDWSAENVAEETVHIYPYGEDNAVEFVREAQDTDNVILDNEYATVIVTGYTEDDIWGYMVELYFVNKTENNLMFSAEDVSVNGYMADPFYSESVAAGKMAFGSMSWLDTTFEENDITEVEEIEFTLTVSNDDDWSIDDYVNETIVLNP